MKITKDEKQLYKFLDVINKLFGKTSNRTHLIGDGNSIYFYTMGYAGLFVSKDDDNHLMSAYDFGFNEYQLKQLPNKEYVLDQCDNDIAVINNIKTFIQNRCHNPKWQMEMSKDYPCKSAKIAVQTNKWMRDDDLSLLKSFEYYEVFTCGDGILFNCRKEIADIYIIFMDSVVAPDADDATQLKLEEIETSLIMSASSDSDDNSTDDENEPLEEFEDDFDPMA